LRAMKTGGYVTNWVTNIWTFTGGTDLQGINSQLTFEWTNDLSGGAVNFIATNQGYAANFYNIAISNVLSTRWTDFGVPSDANVVNCMFLSGSNKVLATNSSLSAHSVNVSLTPNNVLNSVFSNNVPLNSYSPSVIAGDWTLMPQGTNTPVKASLQFATNDVRFSIYYGCSFAFPAGGQLVAVSLDDIAIAAQYYQYVP
jgi:hypothetical protein